MSDQSRERSSHVLKDLARGVRDTVEPIRDSVWRLRNEGTLTAGDTAVTLQIDSLEEYHRVNGHGEQDALTDFERSVTPRDTVWDVGANVGSYALIAGEIGATVVAFEPGARARQQLLENADRNGVGDRIHAQPHALSESDGEAVLRHGRSMGTRALAADGAGDRVTVRRGDSITAPSPDVVKVDVEGEEVAVLDGMPERLDGCRLAYVEVHDGVAVEDVTSRLRDAGLSVTDRLAPGRSEVLVRAER